jgi:hypothetical protein
MCHLLIDGLTLLYYGVIAHIEIAAIVALLVSNKTWSQDYECITLRNIEHVPFKIVHYFKDIWTPLTLVLKMKIVVNRVPA